jgi:hypothetical protein
MGPGEHRPHDEEYWQRPWARALFAGDLFEAIPFGDQPTVVYTAEHDDTPGKHFLGEVAFGYGLLVTPTCDMAEQHGTSLAAHPCRCTSAMKGSSPPTRGRRASTTHRAQPLAMGSSSCGCRPDGTSLA